MGACEGDTLGACDGAMLGAAAVGDAPTKTTGRWLCVAPAGSGTCRPSTRTRWFTAPVLPVPVKSTTSAFWSA